MGNIAIILISAAVFLALIIWFTVDTDHVQKWTGIAFFIAIAGGLFIYGTIDATQFKDMPVIAVLRTVVHTGRMFGNAGDSSHSAFVGIVGENTFTSAFYWLVHFFAYYSVVSALILVLGKSIVQRFRSFILRIRDIELVYGIDDNTIRLGEALSKEKHVSLIFVGTGKVPDGIINRTGALVYSDSDAMKPTARFIKRLSLKKGKDKIRINALSSDDEANYTYAVRMLKLFKEAGLEPSQTELVMFGRASMIGSELQALGDHYGYGSVKVYEKKELAARILLWKYPLAETISFDEKGKATKDVNVLLVGFGIIGQEILRKIVSSGQYEGSSFHVTVFDPSYDKISGFFCARYPGIMENYDIQFEAFDGRSKKLVDFVRKNAENLSEVIVAVGNDTMGQEISYGILDVLSSEGVELPVYQCYSDKIVRNHVHEECVITSVYAPEIMYGKKLNALAKEINHYYYGEGDPEQQWSECDYFSRMSCCASADYLFGLLNRLGIKDPSDISDDMMEILGRSEHLRWNAFHYSMGYQTMNKEDLQKRTEEYKKDNNIRISKDVVNKRHACLVTWDELDNLSEYEYSVTGKKPPYKQMDKDNVKAVCGLIKKIY